MRCTVRYAIPIALCGLLVGCTRHITVRMQQYKLQDLGVTLLAQVQVNDLRTPGIAASKREAAFGVPMGNVTFEPPEAKLVKNVLEVELTKLMQEKGIQTKKDLSCDMLEFGVNTNTTPVYWDVIARINLILKQSGKEYNLFGTHTERTYIWPGETVIKKTVDESFNKIIATLKQVAMEF